MSGGAPAADANNNLFITTGNGAYDGTKDFGDSYLKLSTAGLSVLDSFTPSNQASLDTGDTGRGLERDGVADRSNIRASGAFDDGRQQGWCFLRAQPG